MSCYNRPNEEIISLFDDVEEEATNPIINALLMKERVINYTTIEEKIFFIYTTISQFMCYIFATKNELFESDAMDACVENIVEITSTSLNILPTILKLLSPEYTTHEHSTNVAFFAAIIGNKLKLNNEKCTALIYAALIHDIGKLRIEAQILDKPTFLDVTEFESVKQHSNIGYEILLKNGITSQSILHGVQFHHERMDGSGYPDKLKGKNIPLIARIIGMCDVFDALTTQRTFRKNYSSFQALLLMKKEMKEQLDPKLIDIFIQMHR